jgi:hypothetical protein
MGRGHLHPVGICRYYVLQHGPGSTLWKTRSLSRLAQQVVDATSHH